MVSQSQAPTCGVASDGGDIGCWGRNVTPRWGRYRSVRKVAKVPVTHFIERPRHTAAAPLFAIVGGGNARARPQTRKAAGPLLP